MNRKEFYEKIYGEYKGEIDVIVKASEKENWKADIGVATDMFIKFIDNEANSIFVNVPKAKAFIEAARKELD